VHDPVSQPRGPLPLDVRNLTFVSSEKPGRGLAEHGEVPQQGVPALPVLL